MTAWVVGTVAALAFAGYFAFRRDEILRDLYLCMAAGFFVGTILFACLGPI